MRQIKYSVWPDGGEPVFGSADIHKLAEIRKTWHDAAKALLEAQNHKHVVYCVKQYANGRVQEYRFYMHPCDDEELDRISRSYSEALICAVHAKD